jgi:multiple sugar transport system ATP-binding protein
MARLALEGVTKVYRDGTEAVKDLTLEIPDGSMFVLLGPSGCGKTTVLRMIAGIEEVTGGNIWIGDREVTDDSPKHRDVAMVFQHFGLYPHMTVYDNIAFGLRVRGVGRKERDVLVREAARILGIEDQLRKRPRTLSGGQQQRVGMGRALVRRPQVFLMDEPLSNVDAKLRTELRGEIARIQRDVGITTVYVTHDQLEAMTLGDRVAVMRDGVVQQEGTPQELYQRPRSLFVAAFVGTPAMNLVEATLVDVTDGLEFRFGSHRLAVDGRLLERRPRLRSYQNRQVILGIRPEDLSDAALRPDVPASRRLRARVERREVLGPDLWLHFTVDAPLLLEEDPREAVHLDDEAPWAAERANRFLARVDGRSTAEEGDQVEFAVEMHRVHVFDPVAGTAIED